MAGMSHVLHPRQPHVLVHERRIISLRVQVRLHTLSVARTASCINVSLMQSYAAMWLSVLYATADCDVEPFASTKVLQA